MSARDAARRDDGFTLIELLASSLIFAVIFIVIGSIFMSLVRTQEQVESTTQTTNYGQLLASSLDDGIRNASGFRITTHGADQMVVARTATNTAALSWRCTAWYYSSTGDGSVRTTTSTTAIAAPTSAQLADWTLLLDGVAPRSGTTLFTADGAGLAVAFDALAEGHNPTAIDFTVTPLTGVTEMTPC